MNTMNQGYPVRFNAFPCFSQEGERDHEFQFMMNFGIRFLCASSFRLLP